jgi:ribonuclease H / adenosylcobalamin/alpha-ribazole phosphatase
MPEAPIKRAILDALWGAVERLPFIRSATVAGSFTHGLPSPSGRGVGGSCLEGISDIDTIVVVDRLDQLRFDEMRATFRGALGEVLRGYDYDLIVNATLGPLKFNSAKTAVLHLMPYSVDAHREHVIQSPFTCLDWQRSPLWRKAPLDAVYPVFALQPHHFVSARRGTRDYLSDFLQQQISYRELTFPDGAYQEVKRQQPMSGRDRHEFAYHVLRFLMQNFLKLIRRANVAEEGVELCHRYFAEFPNGAERFSPFFLELGRRKRAGEFAEAMAELD